MKKEREHFRRSRDRGAHVEPLEVGHKLRDAFEHKTGVIVDYACQYSHPKADPIYNYLVRWDDGQVQAITETALRTEHGVKPVD